MRIPPNRGLRVWWVRVSAPAPRRTSTIASNEKSYGVLDLPQMFKLTGSYDFPFGKGRSISRADSSAGLSATGT